MAKNQTKWVLIQTAHLSGIDETFAPGTVITHNADEQSITVYGKTYPDDRDLQALFRFAGKFGKEIIVPYSAEAEKVAKKVPSNLAIDKPPLKGEGHKPMEVIRSDDDTYREIDISHTKVKKPEREAADGKKKKMEVIRGDEDIQERMNRLRNETGLPNMPVVRDDSIGMDGGKSMGNVVKSAPRGSQPKSSVSVTESVESFERVASAPKFVPTQPAKRGRPRKAKPVE